MDNPSNPLITPEKNPSELQKFPLFYEHVNDSRQQARRRSKTTTNK
jgi:hypothetical protein